MPTSAPPKRRGKLVPALVVGLLGIGAGLALLIVGGSNYTSAVESLARAPIGCTTSLEFDQTGDYFVFVETTGTIGELRGDCPGTDSDHDFDGDADDIDVDVVLVDDNGDEIDLDRDDSIDYDTGDFAGVSIATFTIDEAGDVDVTVSSDDEDFAIAIGKDPQGSALIAGLGFVLIALGVLGALVLFILGRRSKSDPLPGSPVAYPPSVMGGYPPQMPPVQQVPPGFGAPGGPPPAAPGWGQPGAGPLP